MREFFRGWRRKVGCLTLVLACVLATMWGRSLVYGDSVTVNRGTMTCDFVASFQGELKWIRSTASAPPSSSLLNGIPTPVTPRYVLSMDFRYVDGDETLMPIFGGSQIEWDWRQKVLGFQYGTGTVSGFRFWTCLIPYWSVVLPLALLAAYLILWKPRKRDSGPPQSSAAELP
ncbi:MAG: hypothetical protein JWP89_3635 [Schlesneria sp.]|nr:hypothetical protein [Schlesneria sp.]